MLGRLLAVGLLTGLIAALVYTAVQAVTVTPLILEAERYEAAPQHHHGPADDPAPAASAGLTRLFATGLANLVTATGFALLLVAAYSLSGRPVDGPRGLLWGLAGFASFSLAPALGLPPELPGAAAAALEPRQAWWIGTAAATALGLGLLVFARHGLLKASGLLLLAVPHLIGAPHPAGEAGAAPPELAARFAVLALATSALLWLVLGWTSGVLYRRTR